MAAYEPTTNSVHTSLIYPEILPSPNCQIGKVAAYRSIQGAGPELVPLNVVHYHIDEGYSIPLISGIFHNTDFVVECTISQKYSDYQVLLSWKENSLKDDNTTYDAIVFKSSIEGTYLIDLKPLEMIFTDRALEK